MQALDHVDVLGVHRKGAASVITSLLTAMGLFVHQGSGSVKLHKIRGMHRRIGNGAWYCVDQDPDRGMTKATQQRIKLFGPPV